MNANLLELKFDEKNHIVIVFHSAFIEGDMFWKCDMTISFSKKHAILWKTPSVVPILSYKLIIISSKYITNFSIKLAIIWTLCSLLYFKLKIFGNRVKWKRIFHFVPSHISSRNPRSDWCKISNHVPQCYFLNVCFVQFIQDVLIRKLAWFQRWAMFVYSHTLVYRITLAKLDLQKQCPKYTLLI